MLAQLIVRGGLAVVFGYMGADKFSRPAVWLIQMPSQLQGFGEQGMFVLGALEVLIALLLVTRFFRIGALGASAILVGAIYTMGINDIAARDAGLLAAALALLLPWEHHLTSKKIMQNYVGLLKGKPYGSH